MKKLVLTLLCVTILTTIYAQVDSTQVNSFSTFIGSIFGKAAGESTAAFIFRMLGYLTIIDALLLAIRSLIPSTSPAYSLIETVLGWFRLLIPDQKKFGGTFKHEHK